MGLRGEAPQQLESYRAYQEVADKHVYIMSQTEPSEVKRVIVKYLKSSDKGNIIFKNRDIQSPQWMWVFIEMERI